MSEFIQFGWDAIGFVAAGFVALFVIGTIWRLLTGSIGWLADYCDKQGWNG